MCLNQATWSQLRQAGSQAQERWKESSKFKCTTPSANSKSLSKQTKNNKNHTAKSHMVEYKISTIWARQQHQAAFLRHSWFGMSSAEDWTQHGTLKTRSRILPPAGSIMHLMWNYKKVWKGPFSKKWFIICVCCGACSWEIPALILCMLKHWALQ